MLVTKAETVEQDFQVYLRNNQHVTLWFTEVLCDLLVSRSSGS